MEPGSPLVGDDAKTAPHHLSHSAHHALVVAVDHLQALAALMGGVERDGRREVLVNTHPPFTLLRAALENAARAVWLLGPTLRHERVHRCLRMHLADLKGVKAKAELMGEVLSDYERRHDRIMNLLRSAGMPSTALSNAKLKMPRYSEIVREAGDLTPIGGDRAELMWSACSALAHGDLTATLGLLDREIVATEGAVSWAKFTGPVKMAWYITTMALDMTDAAFTLYSKRAQFPPR